MKSLFDMTAYFTAGSGIATAIISLGETHGASSAWITIAGGIAMACAAIYDILERIR